MTPVRLTNDGKLCAFARAPSPEPVEGKERDPEQERGNPRRGPSNRDEFANRRLQSIPAERSGGSRNEEQADQADDTINDHRGDRLGTFRLLTAEKRRFHKVAADS